MNDLKGLLHLISKNKVKQIEVIGQPGNRSSKVDQLYEILSSDTLVEERDLSKNLFPDSPNHWNYYLKLRGNLQSRLLNTLFFIDLNESQYTDIQKAYYNCYKDFAAIRILLGKGERNFSIILAEKTFSKCIKFEFTELSLHLSRVLRMHFGQLASNQKKYNFYSKSLLQSLKTLEAELTAEDAYITLLKHVGDDSTEWGRKKQKIQNKLNSLFTKENSYRFILFYYYSMLFIKAKSNNKQELLNICENAIKDLESKKHIKPKQQIAIFLNESIPLCINLRKLEEGEKLSQKAEKLTKAGTINWYNTLLSKTILLLHSDKYQQAFSTFNQATSHENLKRLPNDHQEQWRIIEAFLHFLIEVKKISIKKSVRKFRVGKFLNEVPIYSKEKRGLNITILIIQILFLLQQRKFEAVIDRMDALNTYSYRYLRKNPYFRSNCFLKMLLTLPTSNFNKIASRRKAEKYYNRLLEVPISKANLDIVPEIIPYETLWNLILETLGKPTYKVI